MTNDTTRSNQRYSTERTDSNHLDQLVAHLQRLEQAVEEQAEQIDQLEATTERLEAENEQLRDRVNELEQTTDECTETVDRVEKYTKAIGKKATTNKHRVEELQARELQKGAHLNAENVIPTDVPVETEHLERITKDGGYYYRTPDSEDPLNRGGSVQLSHGDLLPIQQLARMDDDMLRSATSSLPARLAAKLWKARIDPTVGDNPWKEGSRKVKEHLSASDLRHWIRRQEPGISKDYAQKLVSRTIDAILELSQHRLAVHKRDHRKNGLEYIERRLIIPTDTDVPGECADDDDAPETAGVVG